MVKRTFIVHYEQWLEQDADTLGWSEHKEITVRLTSDALTGGWLQQFGDHPVDYLVLTVIALHARPLTDDDIDLLLPLVTAQDKGRLFAYLTDLGLADMLGMNRRTIIASTERLGNNGHLIARKLDKNIQLRFKGRFNGDTVYILSGNVAIRKEFYGREDDRVQKMHTVEDDRVHLMSPSEQGMHTNLNTVDVVVGEIEKVFAYFLERKGGAYEFTEKDRRELDALIADGFSLDDILRGIDAAFALPSKPQRFVQCVRVTRQRFSPSVQTETQTPAIRVNQTPVIRANQTPVIRANQTPAIRANQTPVIRPTDTQTPAIRANQTPVVSVELGNALALFEKIIAAPPADGDAQKLKHLAALCDEAAQEAKSSGVLWLEEALELTLTAEDVKSPIRYAESILRAWIEHGKGADLRPARDGYHPPRRDSAAAPANPAGANGDGDDSDPYRVVDPPLLPLPEN